MRNRIILLVGASVLVLLAIVLADVYPGPAIMHTTKNRLQVVGNSRVGEQLNVGTAGFYYSTESVNYLFDASLILANSANNLSWGMYQSLDGPWPTVDNPWGQLWGTDLINIDSTSHLNYTVGTGQGFNRDSTLGFLFSWYASKSADTSDCYIGSFKVYKGPNGPTGVVSGLTVAYACDWNLPSDTGVDNSAGVDATHQMVYQQGAYGPPIYTAHGGLAALRSDNAAITGGFVWESDQSLALGVTFENDSLWNKMQATSGYTKTDSIEDLNSVLVIYKNATVNGAAHDTLRFYVIIAGQQRPTGTLAGLQGQIARAKRFICTNLNSNAGFCPYCFHGDANGDHSINISDAVFLIQYIFAGGSRPNPLCSGDYNCDCQVNISDAVCLIQYIFNGGFPNCGPFSKSGCSVTCETCPPGYCPGY